MNVSQVLDRVVNHGGITINPFTGEQPTTGYAVCDAPEKSETWPGPDTYEIWVSHMESGLQQFVWLNRGLLTRPNYYLGVWVDPGTADSWVLDIVRVVDSPDVALAIAKAHNQKAVYHLDAQVVVYAPHLKKPMYKVVRVKHGVYSSSNLGLPPEFSLHYRIGQATAPVVGKVFVFKDRDNAVAFVRRQAVGGRSYNDIPPGWAVLEGEAEGVTEAWGALYYTRRSEDIWRFWGNPLGVYNSSVPEGTYFCDTFTPTRVVAEGPL